MQVRQANAGETDQACGEGSITHSFPREVRERAGWMAGKAFFSARKHAILFASADAATVEAMIEIGSNFLKERRSERVREGTERGRERQTHERTATQAHPKAGTPTPPEMKLGREEGGRRGRRPPFPDILA